MKIENITFIRYNQRGSFYHLSDCVVLRATPATYNKLKPVKTDDIFKDTKYIPIEILRYSTETNIIKNIYLQPCPLCTKVKNHKPMPAWYSFLRALNMPKIIPMKWRKEYEFKTMPKD